MADEVKDLPVIYCNATRFQYSIHDFSLVFGLAEAPLDPPVAGKPVEALIRPYNKVIMSPTHFKIFVEVANSVLGQYEKKHGTIPTEKKQAQKSK